MGDRRIGEAKVVGCFGLPIGAEFLEKHQLQYVMVSTVCLEGMHLEDPLGICSEEHGYETMVFLEGSTLLSVFTEKYQTRGAAFRGHKSVVSRLMRGDLPLSIPINYTAWE